jgi:hypothetical protein
VFVASQNCVFIGDGEHVVEPAMCGLSVVTPGHQFHTLTGLVFGLILDDGSVAPSM